MKKVKKPNKGPVKGWPNFVMAEQPQQEPANNVDDVLLDNKLFLIAFGVICTGLLIGAIIAVM